MFEIRRMRAEDSAGMQTVHTNAVSQTCGPMLEPDIVEAWLHGRSPEGYLRAANSGGEVFWVAVDDTGLVVGFASWLGDELVSLFVDPCHEGQGIGQTLFATCQADAEKGGRSISHLSSTINARTFYESLGFRVVRYGFKEKRNKRIPHIEMERG